MMRNRRKSRPVKVSKITIGGKSPIVIQSMCNTKTSDVKKTASQIKKLEKLGCEMVRVAVPDIKAAEKLSQIKKKIKIPLIADIHFDADLALEAIRRGADKIRINPGNISDKEKLREIIQMAKKKNVAIRIGVNAGSLEKKYGHPTPQALVASCLKWVKFFEKEKFRKLVLSAKSSNVLDTIKAYELLAEKCDYPLHIGVTEAGILIPGITKNAIGIGSLLQKGIGDTIRVSLAAPPEKEIVTAKEILKSLGLYKKEPEIIACPSCGRAEIDVIKLAKEVEQKICGLKKNLKIAVMGCIVNGPGEAREADFGIAGGKKCGIVFRKGKVVNTVSESRLVSELMKIINEK